MADWQPVVELSSIDPGEGFRIGRILGTPDDLRLEIEDGGDINGDGIADFFVTNYRENLNGLNEVGVAYYILGSANGFGDFVDIDDYNPLPPPPPESQGGSGTATPVAEDEPGGVRLDGLDKYDITGFSVAAAGDINGDGFADMLISAPGADPDGDEDVPGPTPAAGVTYVMFGSATLPPTGFILADLDGSDGFRIDGVAANDYSGWSVDGIGDFNGDGFGDLIIGAYRVDGDGVGAFSDLTGASYIVFGSGDAFAASMDLADLDGANGFRIDGLDDGDRMGRSVARAGDINGDGLADLIIGAHSADPGGLSGAGESYVVFGSTTPFSASFDLTALDGANGFRIDGAEEGDSSGISVAGAGDVNGDGFDDLIIGAYSVDLDGAGGFGYQGAAYVVFGSDAPFATDLDLEELDGSNGFRLRGDAADGYAEAGVSVSSAGDVNGDGFDDLLIGAQRARPTLPSSPPSGAVYVVFGSAAPFAVDFDLTALNGDNGFRVNAASSADYAGSTVSAAGDINGDGFDDIAISARGTDEGYVIYGRAPTTAVSRVGSDADQVIRGGDFDDTLHGGKGEDTLAGGDGDDRYIVNSLLDSVIEAPGGGEDRVLATKSYALAAGQKIERLEAKDEAGVAEIDLAGNNGDNGIAGNAGVNRLFGSGGDDELSGLAGNDRLYGGAGEDTLDGGAGLDRFYFDSTLDPTNNVDRIADFTAADDAIYLDRSIFAAIGAGPLSGAAFRAGTAAQDASDRIIYNSATGKIWYDADGVGGAAQQLCARVTPGTALTRHDFFGYGTASAGPIEAEADARQIDSLDWIAPALERAPAWPGLNQIA